MCFQRRIKIGDQHYDVGPLCLRFASRAVWAVRELISDYRNASVLCFTETWLKPDTHVEPDGFTVYRGDITVDSGKLLGTGGVCLFVNNRWCNNVTVKDIKCTPKLEL